MQEVIVYRNPVEAAVWNFLMTGEFFVIFCSIVAFFIVLVVVHTFLQKRKWTVIRKLPPKSKAYSTVRWLFEYGAFIIAAFAAGFTYNFLAL